MPKFVLPERSVKTETGVLNLCPCGRTFVPYRVYQKYCSNACRKKYGATTYAYEKKPEQVIVCAFCGTEFKTNDGKKRYCNNQCYLLAQEARHTVPTERVCDVCKKKFISSHWSKKYCSTACRTEARKERENANS